MGEEKRIEYVRATIHTTAQGAEALAAVLPALGITGFSVEDPADLDFIIASKETLIWDYIDFSKPMAGAERGETKVIFWLREWEKAKLSEVRTALLKLKSDEQYGLYGPDAYFGRLWLDTGIDFDDWKNKYKENFRAFSPCEGVEVVPPWEVIKNGRDSLQTKIVIDPGMAFGTGSHETTRMCIERLKTLMKPGDTILDAGTGSGILAIAAALFGAGEVMAVELDEDAAASAARNIEANGANGKVTLITGDLTAEGILPADVRYDLITANLTCQLLERLLPVFKQVLKEEGAMILSGLLDAQESRIIEALENEGLRVFDVAHDGEWLMIEALK